MRHDPTRLLTRFWAKVEKNGPVPSYRPDLGPCWVWNAFTSRGYGRFNLRGQMVHAHRAAFMLLVGPIPLGFVPDHLCRVRSCVKVLADEYGPAHIELVTPRENTLRGETVTAANTRKTHCPKGHLYDYVGSTGYRGCKQCRRQQNAESYRRVRARTVGSQGRAE